MLNPQFCYVDFCSGLPISQRLMKIVKIAAALKRLKKVNNEIRYLSCFEQKHFTSGLIAFKPSKKADPKQISHDDQDVICQVLQGSGRLRIDGRKIRLAPGTLCHIPKKTPHDFAAARSGELVLLYLLIKT
ncbi:MAG TPA: cupin domain-containing protein [Gammaproteobacteria bacterium]|nr:cupin domain-containing protein [Gammaproteobacteria bacterium]